MADGPTLAWAFATGAAVGALYLLMLWRAVGRLAGAARPGLALLAGGAARVAVVVLALMLVTGGSAMELLAALVGFTLVRLLATRRASRRHLPPVGR